MPNAEGLERKRVSDLGPLGWGDCIAVHCNTFPTCIGSAVSIFVSSHASQARERPGFLKRVPSRRVCSEASRQVPLDGESSGTTLPMPRKACPSQGQGSGA